MGMLTEKKSRGVERERQAPQLLLGTHDASWEPWGKEQQPWHKSKHMELV